MCSVLCTVVVSSAPRLTLPPLVIFIDTSYEYEHVRANIMRVRKVGIKIIAVIGYSKFWLGICRG